MAKSLKTYSSVLWEFEILKVKSRYLQELIKSFPVEFFLSFSSYIDEILFDFSQKLFDKERIVIAFNLFFVWWTCKSCFAFLTLMVVQSKCGIRVTDGVGEVLNGMMGSNMRHLVKVLMQLENLAQIKFQKKGFVITIIHCYGNKESFLCIEQFVFAMNLMHWYFEMWS